MHKFFTQKENINETEGKILGDDVKHIYKVLRLSEGEKIVLNNCNGKEYLCEISSISKTEVLVDIIEELDINNESNINIYLFQGLPKSQKMDLIVQKGTELGVLEFIPVITERVDVKLKGDFKKLDRLNRIVLEAAKQSKRSIIPKVLEPIEFNEVLKEVEEMDLFLVPYENAEDFGLKGVLKTLKENNKIDNIKNIGIMVGPEGGFEESEIEALKEMGAYIIWRFRRKYLMKVAFSTLGCRVNQYESEAMAEKFIREGYEVVDFSEIADVYVINTCTVTNMGDKKSRQIISKARRLNNNAIIAVVGCYSQIAPKEVSAIEGVDVVLGTRNKGDVVYYVNKARDEQKIQVHVEGVLKNKKFEDLNIEEYQDKTRAFLKIQDGCNRFCTYCAIPYARGSVCSKEPRKVIDEIKKLASHGFKEVILSGIHTASYGLDLEGNITLIDLIEDIEKIDGIERVRIGSIEPAFFTNEVIEKIKK